MWTQETFTADNGFVKIPERTVVPKPQQKPHPAMWQTCSSLDSFFSAGKLGLGVLGVTLLVPLSTLAELLDNFDRGRAEREPLSQVDNDQKGVFTFVHCTETREQAIESRAAEAAMWYVNTVPEDVRRRPKRLDRHDQG
jgi:alkanesulfonate monooxygenase SsuD/methylene tetrahydromethanopterin reductase-like flavin-dependent oxidoreductase (luciferase family)